MAVKAEQRRAFRHALSELRNRRNIKIIRYKEFFIVQKSGWRHLCISSGHIAHFHTKLEAYVAITLNPEDYSWR